MWASSTNPMPVPDSNCLARPAGKVFLPESSNYSDDLNNYLV